MHAAHRGRMTVQRMRTMTRFRVPNLQSAICAARYDDGSRHLRRPHTTRVPHQSSEAL